MAKKGKIPARLIRVYDPSDIVWDGVHRLALANKRSPGKEIEFILEELFKKSAEKK